MNNDGNGQITEEEKVNIERTVCIVRKFMCRTEYIVPTENQPKKNTLKKCTNKINKFNS